MWLVDVENPYHNIQYAPWPLRLLIIPKLAPMKNTSLVHSKYSFLETNDNLREKKTNKNPTKQTAMCVYSQGKQNASKPSYCFAPIINFGKYS